MNSNLYTLLLGFLGCKQHFITVGNLRADRLKKILYKSILMPSKPESHTTSRLKLYGTLKRQYHEGLHRGIEFCCRCVITQDPKVSIISPFNDSKNFPDYLLNDPEYEGGAERQSNLESGGNQRGWVAKQCFKPVRERFQCLIKNLPETAVDTKWADDKISFFKSIVHNQGIISQGYKKRTWLEQTWYIYIEVSTRYRKDVVARHLKNYSILGAGLGRLPNNNLMLTFWKSFEGCSGYLSIVKCWRPYTPDKKVVISINHMKGKLEDDDYNLGSDLEGLEELCSMYAVAHAKM
ncbi:hypothetical protein CONCODRAFT_3852 [Conidiobolus coronatus NRRL 28638]|uniref:Uncharacterized protein n=1 Tax=Conidiobolus coronatus (strain ATCC 28846 / CBS 209.66 / NRRL 28638) TaxID=796925 RepID=A0A137PDW4_CONC2|nr:hypothetical protein CONCODRAFT_3852 [Conidiobolus coronatus NRRL 28638]|eukprot:KXN73187.1 hypothetical protein CONCODRAFT_3852 [Conidiobolus coronatus NRRL 28638]